MKLILVDDVFELGRRGQVVRVADGYGRNYLIPRKLAVLATPGNLKMVEQQRLVTAKKEAKYKDEANLLAKELKQLHVVVSRKSGETGTLFGSVTSKDVAELLQQEGIEMDRRKILLGQPIKAIGNYQIELRPHSEVAVQLLVSVVVEGDKAVAKVKKKDEESDQIVAGLESKIEEIEQLMGTEKSTQEQPKEIVESEAEGLKGGPAEVAEEAVESEAEESKDGPAEVAEETVDSEAEAELPS